MNRINVFFLALLITIAVVFAVRSDEKFIATVKKDINDGDVPSFQSVRRVELQVSEDGIPGRIRTFVFWLLAFFRSLSARFGWGQVDGVLPDSFETLPPDFPSMVPSDAPSSFPSDAPSSMPSDVPSSIPSDSPSLIPSDAPSMMPSDAPSGTPSFFPSDIPSDFPSIAPSLTPSDIPSMFLSDSPSMFPSDSPSMFPSDSPSMIPSDTPSDVPSLVPSDGPSLAPIATTDDVVVDSDSLPSGFDPCISDDSTGLKYGLLPQLTVVYRYRLAIRPGFQISEVTDEIESILQSVLLNGTCAPSVVGVHAVSKGPTDQAGSACERREDTTQSVVGQLLGVENDVGDDSDTTCYSVAGRAAFLISVDTIRDTSILYCTALETIRTFISSGALVDLVDGVDAVESPLLSSIIPALCNLIPDGDRMLTTVVQDQPTLRRSIK